MILRIAGCACLAFVLACDAKKPADVDAGTAFTPPTASTAPESPSASPSSTASAAILPPSRPRNADGCIALGIVGSVTNGETRVTAGALPDAWLTLGASTHLTSKHGTTTRELVLHGPGKVRPCIAGEEQFWLLSGTIGAMTTGAGESPGAEVWIATAHAMLRYASAAASITASDASTELREKGGIVFAWHPDDVVATHSALPTGDAGAPTTAAKDTKDAKDAGSGSLTNSKVADGFTRVEAGSLVTWKPKAKLAADAAVSVCERAADAAQALAVALGKAGAPVGELAPKHIVARQGARAACGVAHVRIEGMPAGKAKDEWTARTAAADAKWQNTRPASP